MAVQFDKGVVVGADSRTTTGAYIVGSPSLYASIKTRIVFATRPTV